MAPEVVFTKYPSPATAVKLAVFSVCQSVPAAIVTEAPKRRTNSFNVILEFANLALAIVPC
jgi:hypothetical protein